MIIARPFRSLRPMTLRVAMASAVLFLSACAPATRVILLPQPDGSPSGVDVTTAKGSQALTQPYQTSDVSKAGDLKAGQTSAEAVQKDFGQLLSMQPDAPKSFVLQFKPGTSELTEESQATLPAIVTAARSRAGGEIIIVGHTDRQGSLEDNDALSLRRAQAVREQFLSQGFNPELVQAVGRGEREPVVPTDDDVAEPLNRRAEIVVR